MEIEENISKTSNKPPFDFAKLEQNEFCTIFFKEFIAKVYNELLQTREIVLDDHRKQLIRESVVCQRFLRNLSGLVYGKKKKLYLHLEGLGYYLPKIKSKGCTY